MSVSFGAQTGLVLVDARPQAGRCYLPLSQTLLGRTVTIKDQFGVAAVSSIQVLTNSPDTFEDGTTSRWITHGYGFMTISATASNVWTVVGGTRQPSFQASTISTFFVNTQSISSFQSAVSQEVVSTLSAGTAYIGTISTANLAAPSPLFSTAQLLDTGTGTYQTVSLSSSFLYINNTAAPTIVIPTQLVSTVAGLGTTNYISTLSLNSTIAGLGTATYVSSPSLTSSLLGLGSIGYVSSLSMTSSIISTVAGLGTASFISSLSLTSSLVGLGNAGFISSATLLSTAAGLTSNISSLIDPVELTSTIVGMGAVGFISTIGLTSTVQGLGTVGFISTATLVSTVFGLRAETSTVAATAFTGSTVSLSAGTIYVSSFKTSVLNASTAIVTWNGSAAPTNYGLAVDTLTLQTTNAGYGAGIASMAFATATAAYPLARIYAVDSASSGPANSQLVFQTVPLSASSFSSNYSYTGANQTFTVPAGVTTISVAMWGAGGGGGRITGITGGAGAFVQGTLAVTPGQVLTLVVGQGGVFNTAITTYGGGGAGHATNCGSGGGRSAIQTTLPVTITTAVGGGTSVTYTTNSAHGLSVGQPVIITGLTPSGYNGTFVVTSPGTTSFVVINTTTGTSSGTGTIVAELLDMGGGGGGGFSTGTLGGAASYSGSASSGSYGTDNTVGSIGGGATQTSGGTAGIGNNGNGYAGALLQGGNGAVNSPGGGGGYYGGGGAGWSANGGSGAGGGSSYTSYTGFTLITGSNSANGNSAPATGYSGYQAGVAAGGAGTAAGGAGLILLASIGNAYAEAMRIGTTGNVGIGTAAPAALLDVAGTSRAQTLSSLTVNASTITLNTGKLSTLNVVGSLDMSNTQIANTASVSITPMYNATNSPMPSAGGTYSTYLSSSVLYALFTFTTPGTTTFTPTATITGAKLLVVGGGGSGGGPGYGGGGGAGGLVYASELTIPAGSYSIVVGAGGASIVTGSYNIGGNNGNNSSALGYTGIGGGGGGSDGSTAGKNGGCGGGGGYGGASAPPGTGSQGYGGGTGNISAAYGGGGGGMGSAGSNYNSALQSVGGAGVVYSITGSNVGYAAGGGSGTGTATAPIGGSANGSIIGGTGGAGASASGTAGLANTGSGGGGSQSFSPYTSGAGGSGIVAIAYPLGSAFSYNVGSITGDANSNLSLQVTNKLSITGNTQIAGALQTSTSATAFQTLSTLAINDRTTPSTGSLYQISSVLYYNSTVIGGVTAASIQAFTF